MEQEVLNTEVPKEESIAVEANVQQDNQQTETPEQINWKKFREAREAERKQKEAAERRAIEKEQEAAALKAAMEAILNKPTQPPRQEQSYYDEEQTEEQRIEKKILEALAVREKKAEEERREREHRELPQRLVANYTDFNEVCSAENLDYLEYHYPEVAEAFKHAPDGYEKWTSVYKAVKRFVPNTNSRKDQMRAEKNFSKPQSMAVPGVTQVGDTAPIKMDDKRRADNWARMQRVMKGG